jgi:protein gp37
MFSDKKRYGQNPNVVMRSKTTFRAPLKWPRQPTLCFTCSWSDWLIEESDAWREEAYEIIRATPWITYQVLTKRIERAVGRVPYPPLPNVWLGVSIEDRPHKYRMQELAETPAAVRFISFEPLLEDIGELDLEDIDWVICGGESGPGARPLNIDWARGIQAQCKAANVAFFMKQLGPHPYEIVGHGFFPHCPDQPSPVNYPKLKDKKGGDMSEWPGDLRIRQFPNQARIAAS